VIILKVIKKYEVLEYIKLAQDRILRWFIFNLDFHRSIKYGDGLSGH